MGRREEGGQVGHFFQLAEPAERDMIQRRLFQLTRQDGSLRGREEARCNRVDGDLPWPHLLGQRLGEADDAGL